MRKTFNGAPVLKRTDSACVDLFSFVGSARKHPAVAIQAFERAYKDDPKLALRILLWARDARGGAGERDTFRFILHWLERRHPDVAFALVRAGAVQQFGRWDDMLHLQSAAVWPAVEEQVFLALADNDRLAAKWMPRTGPVAARFCRALGAKEATWRRALAELSDTVEQRMCAGDWRGIDFSKVPSVASARLQSVFRTHDGERYDVFLEDVKAGRTTMKAGVVFPHDIVKASDHDDAAATVQWSQLPKPVLAGSALVLCDVSGSMGVQVSGNTSAMDVCIALGLLLSENLPEPFRNQVVTFTGTPHWHTVEGATLAARAESLRSADWGTNTNIQAAFDLILKTATAARAAGVAFEMPSALVVLSDMEFDSPGVRGRTNHQVLERKFRAAGFELPTLVYWNLNGRSGNVPAGNRAGVVLVSGYSPRIADIVLSGAYDQLSPDIVMREAVCVPRYDLAGLTC
ncbi:hypothetical protein WJ96_07235 [Burkholderia ubonensis]|uniref:DUF2828 family protein n=1 Tax=Burkholderia ubonensis TaxID=101571 RepID=A0AAW3MZR8_9BURK|nr:DUF2828 family protein [Burkholderia ubonensis]KVP75493.1 hypothetical protein WJ93_09025 [Burkholderia ubonensis]KVP98307.1 hypothetical protein WJ96_07235 [Burkholderia ubonensis]KVZ93005.1 hypothetical protein WL25_18895 [Burkholderia ubonensis]